MNWEQIGGKWSQVKGDIRQKWGKLTDNDLEVVAGSKDKLVGRIQERYGIAKEEAQRQLDEWVTTVGSGQTADPNESRARRKGA
jgi:uncharacterized protein YjbJ (UPF0337 family)